MCKTEFASELGLSEKFAKIANVLKRFFSSLRFLRLNQILNFITVTVRF